jgi:hypothetical protein
MRPYVCALIMMVGLAGSGLAADPEHSGVEHQAAAPEKDKRDCSKIEDAEEQTLCLVDRNVNGDGVQPPAAAAPAERDF